MLDATDWFTDWDVRVPRWVYYFPCPARVAYEHAKIHGWADTLAWGSSSVVANQTVEKLAKSSGSKLVGVEMRACYDRDLERIIQQPNRRGRSERSWEHGDLSKEAWPRRRCRADLAFVQISISVGDGRD